MKNLKIIGLILLFSILITKLNTITVRGEIIPFNLGTVEIKHQKKIIPFELTGALSVPESEGEFPIVFIIPDLEVTESSMDDYYKVLKGLNQKQVLGVMLDLSLVQQIDGADEQLVTTIFEKFRIFLNRAIQGESLAFKRDLSHKGTFSNVFMVGYGQNVDSVFKILEKEHEKQMSFSGIILIEPQRKREVPEKSLPDVPTSIVLPYSLLEKNAISLSLFQKNRNEENRQSMTSMVYVHPDTSLMQMSKIDYSNFINNYISGFVDSVFADPIEGMGLSAQEISPKMMFNTAVTTSLILPDSLSILHPPKEKDAHINALGGSNRFINLRLDHYKGLVDTYKINILSDGKSQIEIELPEKYRDLSSYDALSFYLSYKNEQSKSMTFSVEFIDMEGQRQEVKVNHVQALNYLTGTTPPFYHERIILQELMEVDLTSIRYINIHFKDKYEGELSIGDVTLTRDGIKDMK